MDSKLALIVDDSKSAQHILKRMLTKFQLRADEAYSAEEALAYLSHRQPDVIFLDEHMPGMNGIEALRTLKTNPSTALIPVIMYTSEENDVFVTQARALGALDILSKSDMQPSSLARVLSSLRLFSDSEAGTQPDAAAPRAFSNGSNASNKQNATEATLPGSAAQPVSDLERVSAQISRLFEIHISSVRDQINQSAVLISKRIAANIEKGAYKTSPSTPATQPNALSSAAVTGDKSAAAGQINVDALLLPPPTTTSSGKVVATISSSLLALLLAALAWGGYQLFRVQGELEQTTKNYQTALDSKKQDAQLIASSVLQLMDDKNSNKALMSNPAFLQVMAWLQQVDFQFGFGEQALSEAHVARLNTLMQTLANGAYVGPVVVHLHFGNFCMEPAPTNTWRLAQPDKLVTDCKMLKDLNPKFAADDYVTTSFRNLDRNLERNLEKPAVAQDHRVSLRLVSDGLSQPRADYPALAASTTAGEWNAVALKNNRIAVQLAN
jgi:CheY-like chemotaxis protein